MKRVFCWSLVLLLWAGSAQALPFSRSKKIFRKGDGTWVKLIKGKKTLRPFDHPAQFSEEAMDRYLASIRYFRPEFYSVTGKTGKEWDLLSAEERAPIVPHLVKAFALAKPDQWVDFSISAYRGTLLIGSYRQSDGVMFVKDGELNIVFRNIALKKSPAEVTPKTNPTKSYTARVRIAPGPGQRLMPGTRLGKEVDKENWVVMSAKEAPPLATAVKPEREPEEPIPSSIPPDQPVPAQPQASPAPAPPASASEASPAPELKPSTRERLQELKALYDEGLISHEEYLEKREQILQEL